MSSAERIMSQQNKLYRTDEWLQAVYDAIGIEMDAGNDIINSIKNDILFDTASEEAIEVYERELAITPSASQTLSDRASTIEAKWKQSGKNSISLMQIIADSWKNGAISVRFLNGVLEVKFIGYYGIPDDLQTLKDNLEEVKPAHLPIVFTFKYHVWNDYSLQKWSDLSEKNWEEVLEEN